jgi:hypothetical protein
MDDTNPGSQQETNRKENKPVKKRQNENAFSVLMNSAKKRTISKTNERITTKTTKPTSGNATDDTRDNQLFKSRLLFVSCPAGCGSRLLENEVNDHLDICLVSATESQLCEKNNLPIQQPLVVDTVHIDLYDHHDTLGANDNNCHTTNENNSQSTNISLDVTKQPVVNDDSIDHDNNDLLQKSQKPLHCSELLDKNNAFNILMSNSKAKPKLRKREESCSTMTHRLHLNKDFSVSLYIYDNVSTSGTQSKKIEMMQHASATSAIGEESDMWTPDDCCWSESSRITFKQDKVDDIVTDEKISINLLVSSSIPSYATNGEQHHNHRLVTHQSKLSVPVLKSILQKSIRRRKPIPSVHVAMEIIDKACEALFRRLPIIILEDSTLHPNFNLLVWLMIACSKEYVPSSTILQTVLTTIYEVASCPWHDKLSCDLSTTNNNLNDINDENDKQYDYVFFRNFVEKLHQEYHIQISPTVHSHQSNLQQQYSVVSEQNTLVYCMFVRAEYGGMNCDVNLLRQSATTWLRRFNNDSRTIIHIPTSINTRLSSTVTQSMWMKLYWTVHESAMEQSRQRLGLLNNNESTTDLVGLRLKCLTLQDITIEGVDFHCSPVLRHVMNLSDRQLDWVDHVSCMYPPKTTTSNVNNVNTPSTNNLPDPLESYLKQCMWDYLSGINYRLPLERLLIKTKPENIQQQQEQNKQPELFSEKVSCPSMESVRKDIWNKYFVASIRAYQLRYVQDRLSSQSY